MSKSVGKMTMPLYGELTIAQVVATIEEDSKVKVTQASLNDGIVTLTYETLPDVDDMDEFEECYDCGGTCNDHMCWCPHNYA